MRTAAPISLLAALFLGAGLASAGCKTGEQVPPVTSAAAKKDDPAQALKAEVKAISEAWWDLLMERHPTWATESGDHRYDDKLEDVSLAARARYAQQTKALLEQAQKIKTGATFADLSTQDRLTVLVLERDTQDVLSIETLGFYDVAVNQMVGLQANFPYFALHQHPMETRRDVENLIARYQAVATWSFEHIANLKRGLEAERSAPRVVVERVIGQLDDLLREEDPQKNPLGKATERLGSSITGEERARLKAALLLATRNGVWQGFARYRDFLRDEYLPKARLDVSLSAMPGGAEAYAHLVKQHTTTEMTPDEIHQLGLDELARIEGETLALAKQRGHTGDVRSFLQALRADPKQYAPGRDELLQSFKDALKRADAALPQAFGRLPTLAYSVEPMDAQREKDAPAAYYQPGSQKAGREGVFVANLYRFEERPLFNSPVLAYHEAVPGHHLQIAIAQELEGLPRFRAEGGVTAFVEGWALYSERLSDELGLYTTLEERVGFLGFAAWRASRLVVDTGLHHKGWTRQHAIDFLAAHTTLGPVDVENEIDRYIVIPGQALAYMVGCLHILDLRARMKQQSGDRFSLPAFHDALLGAGPLPLGLLDAQVSASLGLPPSVPPS